MEDTHDFDLKTGEGLIACARCDALYREVRIINGQRQRCIRCNAVLASPRAGAYAQVVALSMTSIVLMFAAVFFPFLEISRMGIGNATSLFGVAMAFSHGWLMPLTLVVLAVIVGLPVLRAALLIYILAPLLRGGTPWRHAARAFRMTEEMRPWSMAEIFVIGTSVALVKVAGLAKVGFGSAFWAFCALIAVTAIGNWLLCSTCVWNAIEAGGAQADGHEPDVLSMTDA